MVSTSVIVPVRSEVTVSQKIQGVINRRAWIRCGERGVAIVDGPFVLVVPLAMTPTGSIRLCRCRASVRSTAVPVHDCTT